MRRKVLAPRARSVVEHLESRKLLSATYAAGAGSAIISGVVYNDVNGNGIQDAGEPVIVGATVTLAAVGVNYAPGTMPTVQTDASGAFSFTSLAPGQYEIGSVPATGFFQDAPGIFVVSVAANDSVAFTLGETSSIAGGGSGLGTISGTLFNDLNQSGVYVPADEDFLAGDTVYLDLNGSGVLTANDPQTTTDNIGQYTLDVPPGAYLIRVVPRPGFHQDPPGYAQVDVYSDQIVSQNIGENNRSTINGVLFNDINSNGVQDAGETGVAGETVYLDINLDDMPENGVYDPTTGLWNTDPTTGGNEPFTTTDATGHYQFTGLTPGTYRIMVQSLVGLLQDAPGYTDVNLAQGQDLIQNIGEGIPITVTGTVYDDRDANGTLDPGEVGLANQTVFLDTNDNGVLDDGVSALTGLPSGLGPDGLSLNMIEPAAVTNASGNYIISDVNPGAWTLRLQTPPGGIPTGPNNATHGYTYTIPSGEVLQNQNFGFQTPDLTPEIVGFSTAPTLTGVRKTARVRVTDVGSLPCIGQAAITLWAQTTNAAVDITTADIVGSSSMVNVHLLVGQSKIIRFSFFYPIQLPTNSYYITAQVTSTVNDNNPSNDFSAPIGPVKITQPFIDLGVTYAAPPADVVDPGQPTAVSLLVTNTGNVTTTGSAVFRIYLSEDPMIEPTDVVVQTITISNLRVRPGKSRIVNLLLPFPGQDLGFRYINVYLDSGDPLGETNLTNNTAIAPSETRFD